MSDATVNLIFRASDLASGAVSNLASGLGRVADSAASSAGRVAGAFSGMADKLANGVGNAVENLASGGSLGSSLLTLGAYMAGQLAESFGGQILERIGSSSIIAAITAPLSALGSAMGSIIAAAVPVGMALLPVLLIGAIVAVIAILIANPEIRDKVIGFAGQVVGTLLEAIKSGLGALAGLVSGIFSAAWQLIVAGVRLYIDTVVRFWLELPGRLIGLGAAIVGTIVNGLASLPGKVADIVGGAFRSLHLDIGPFHISASGVVVDIPKIDLPHFAAGGMTPGGPVVVGELGPEIVLPPRGSQVIPNGALAPGGAGGSSGDAIVRLEGVSPAQLASIIDRELYFRLRRSPATEEPV